MRVCFDTNTFIRIFSRSPAFTTIRQALTRRRLSFLEYREIVDQHSRYVKWADVVELLDTLKEIGSCIEVSPSFRFQVITPDADDNKFSDCAIAGDADFVVTEDRHFSALTTSGYKPRPITAEDLARLLT
jgi:uncharacterized protein